MLSCIVWFDTAAAARGDTFCPFSKASKASAMASPGTPWSGVGCIVFALCVGGGGCKRVDTQKAEKQSELKGNMPHVCIGV